MSLWREEETGPSGFTLAQQIACVKREIALRLRVYPGWVKGGRMKSEVAVYEQAVMTQVLRTLEALIDDGR
jgi:hypothetical protein